jgi:hypothetical protein
MLLRYGMGRTRQFWVSGWRPTFHQVLPGILIATVLILLSCDLEMEFAILWLVASAIIAVSCDSRLRGWQRLVAGLAAPLIPLIYAMGQAMGWVALLYPTPDAKSEVVILDEQGNRLG